MSWCVAKYLLAVVFLLQTTFVPQSALACTGITIKPKDGSVIFSRTLEFAIDTKSNLVVIPRNQTYVGTTPDGAPGRSWKNQYAMIGMSAFGMPITLDGFNEQGLHVGLFYYPSGYAQYMKYSPEVASETVAPWELGTYLLSNCANVEEARAAVKTVVVPPVVESHMGIVPGVHFVVTDAAGKSMVIEPTGGELKIHENPLGVMTNAPSFDWHMTNLTNYVNLSVNNVNELEIGTFDVHSAGQGTGLHGLPGDFTPASRFVRAAIFSKNAPAVETAREGVVQAFHLLNQFDIPPGSAVGITNGVKDFDYTLWTGSSDLKNLRYHFRTFDNSQIRMVDLKQCDLDAKEIKTYSIAGGQPIEDLTETAK